METVTIRSGSKVLAQFEVRPYSNKATAVYGAGVGKLLPLFNGLRVSLNSNLRYSDGHSPGGYAAGLIFPKGLYKKVMKILTSAESAKLFKNDKSTQDYVNMPVWRPQMKFSKQEILRQQELQLRLF